MKTANLKSSRLMGPVDVKGDESTSAPKKERASQKKAVPAVFAELLISPPPEKPSGGRGTTAITTGTFGKAARFGGTFTTRTGLQGHLPGDRDQKTHSPSGVRAKAVERDAFANFAVPQGPEGAARMSGNMTSKQQQQIVDAFAAIRSQGKGGLGTTIPVPGTPDGSPQPSRAASPIEK